MQYVVDVFTDKELVEKIKVFRERIRNEERTSMLVALSFSSITCFRMVRDDLMASFNVMDCELPSERGANRKDATW